MNVQATCHQVLLKWHRFPFFGQPICLDFIGISLLQIGKDLLLGTRIHVMWALLPLQATACIPSVCALCAFMERMLHTPRSSVKETMPHGLLWTLMKRRWKSSVREWRAVWDGTVVPWKQVDVILISMSHPFGCWLHDSPCDMIVIEKMPILWLQITMTKGISNIGWIQWIKSCWSVHNLSPCAILLE